MTTANPSPGLVAAGLVLGDPQRLALAVFLAGHKERP
jgi:hypothetical protein